MWYVITTSGGRTKEPTEVENNAETLMYMLVNHPEISKEIGEM